MAERTPIPKSLRFEVFKRDSFTCQYCGAKAPDVVLNIDHIVAVAAGGGNDILNLVTSCFSCNSGKSDRALDDHSALMRQRRQLEELEERRAQLEMMVQWRKAVEDFHQLYANEIAALIASVSGMSVNDSGLVDVSDWLRRFTFEEVSVAVRKSFATYLRRDDKGQATEVSWHKAFWAIPKIARVDKAGGMPPERLRAFYARGILRRRIYVNEDLVMSMIFDAMEAGANVEDIVALAKRTPDWSSFCSSIFALSQGKDN